MAPAKGGDGATSGTDQRSASPFAPSTGSPGDLTVDQTLGLSPHGSAPSILGLSIGGRRPPADPHTAVSPASPSPPSAGPAPPVLGLSIGWLPPPEGSVAVVAASPRAPSPPSGLQARRLAVQDPSFAPDGVPAPAIVFFPPGRAGGMLPDPVGSGDALVAATARALGVAHGPSDSDDSASDDDGVFVDVPTLKRAVWLPKTPPLCRRPPQTWRLWFLDPAGRLACLSLIHI